MRSSLTRLAPLVAMVLVLAACASGGRVTGVAIDQPDTSLVVGDTLQLSASVATTGDVSPAVAWTSGEATVASVDAAGLVTALDEGTTDVTATSSVDPSQSDSVALTVRLPGDLRWTRQFGTAGGDRATGVATDPSGHVHVAGTTLGDLDAANAGSGDVFVRSLDADGLLAWSRQFGTAGNDYAAAIATDANGDVYVTGYTTGALEGAHTGSFDVFVRAYDGDGELRWTRQFGTSGVDRANGIAADDGGVYVVGFTDGALGGGQTGAGDAFLRAYTANGDLRWTRQFGTSSADDARGVATDGEGDVYVVGSTSGALEGDHFGSSDAFVRSFDAAGATRWTRQFGTDLFDGATGVATSASGDVVIGGFTFGDLAAGQAGAGDVFVHVLDANGDVRWSRQFGTSSADLGTAVATDRNGLVYVGGTTSGAFEGVAGGEEDAFVRAYDAEGALRWTRQFGTPGVDEVSGLATDPSGHAYVAGRTSGVLDGDEAGADDAFVRSYGR